jgi:hypothetical protein
MMDVHLCATAVDLDLVQPCRTIRRVVAQGRVAPHGVTNPENGARFATGIAATAARLIRRFNACGINRG